jgi:hypothetical protein
MEYRKFEVSSIGDGKGSGNNGFKAFLFVVVIAILIYAIMRVKKYLDNKKQDIMSESLK